MKPVDSAGRSRAAFDPRALLLAIVVVVLSGVLGAALLVFQREQSLAEGQRLTDVFTRLMDEQTSRTVQTLDQRLELISLEIGAMKRSGTFSETNMRTKLDQQLVHLPFVMSLAVLDAQGLVRFNSVASGDRVDQSGEEHFRIYQTRPGAGFYLGTPRRVGQPSEWVLQAARPIHDDAGQLTGVVVATVVASYFDRLWQSLALESGSAMSLLRTDGTMLLRSPQDDTAMDRNFGKEPLFTQYLPTSASGHFRQSNPIDGSARLAAYRTLERYPQLLVVVARTLDAVLAPWRQLVRMVVGGWLLASGLVIALVITIGRASAQRREAENTTSQMAQRLSLASNAAGIVLWDWDVRTGHWHATPTFYTALGYPARDGPID
jgi:PAS domain-containing protein